MKSFVKLYCFFFFSLYLCTNVHFFAMEHALYSAIKSAIKRNDLQKVQELTASHDFNPNQVNFMDKTYLHHCCELNCDTNLTFMNEYVNFDDQQKRDELLQKIFASEKRSEIIKHLIDKGVSCKNRAASGKALLSFLFQHESCKILCACYHGPYSSRNYSQQEIEFLVKLHNGLYERVAQTFLECGAHASFHDICVSKNLRYISMLLEAGTPLMEKDSDGNIFLQNLKFHERDDAIREFFKLMPTQKDKDIVELLLRIYKRQIYKRQKNIFPKPVWFNIIALVLSPLKLKTLQEQKLIAEDLQKEMDKERCMPPDTNAVMSWSWKCSRF